MSKNPVTMNMTTGRRMKQEARMSQISRGRCLSFPNPSDSIVMPMKMRARGDVIWPMTFAVPEMNCGTGTARSTTATPVMKARSGGEKSIRME